MLSLILPIFLVCPWRLVKVEVLSHFCVVLGENWNFGFFLQVIFIVHWAVALGSCCWLTCELDHLWEVTPSDSAPQHLRKDAISLEVKEAPRVRIDTYLMLEMSFERLPRTASYSIIGTKICRFQQNWKCLKCHIKCSQSIRSAKSYFWETNTCRGTNTFWVKTNISVSWYHDVNWR